MEGEKQRKNKTIQTNLPQQIKSKKRVKEFAEVFTAEREVKAMVDLVWDKLEDKINASFLEPSVGTGNFLVEILARKLKHCKSKEDIKNAYSSLYAYDIQEDNVSETKQRLLKMNPNPSIENHILSIMDKNILVGDWLKIQGLDPKNKYK